MCAYKNDWGEGDLKSWRTEAEQGNRIERENEASSRKSMMASGSAEAAGSRELASGSLSSSWLELVLDAGRASRSKGG